MMNKLNYVPKLALKSLSLSLVIFNFTFNVSFIREFYHILLVLTFYLYSKLQF